MSARVILLAASLLALGACASPTQGVTPLVNRTVSADAGAVLTAAPGEVIYSETTTRFVWMLSVAEDAAIGPYTVEAGEYPLEGLSRSAYFFGVGDDCAGEAAVTAGRFADAAQHLMVPADGGRTCVVPVFDHARCGAPVGEMRAEPEPGADQVMTSLTYDGIEPGTGAAPPLARFTLITEDRFTAREESLTATVPGVLTAANGQFRIMEADDSGVVLVVEQAIAETPDLDRPDLSEAQPNW